MKHVLTWLDEADMQSLLRSWGKEGLVPLRMNIAPFVPTGWVASLAALLAHSQTLNGKPFKSLSSHPKV